MRGCAGSSFTRRTRWPCTFHQVRFMHARDAVNRVIDRAVKYSEAARGDRRVGVAGANGIERGVIPVSHDIGTRWNADARGEIYRADGRDEERTSKNRAH